MNFIIQFYTFLETNLQKILLSERENNYIEVMCLVKV